MGLHREDADFQVPFEFGGQTVHLMITAYTTFNDIIHMLTSKTMVSDSNAKLYAVFESTLEFERKIGGAVRVLCIWKSWGYKTRHFRFVVKHKQNLMSPGTGTESDMHICMNKSMETKEEAGNVTYEVNESQGEYKFNSPHSYASLANIAFHLDRTNTSQMDNVHKEGKSILQKLSEVCGKRFLLAKYFSGIKKLVKVKPFDVCERENPEGEESTSKRGCRLVDGAESTKQNGNRCRNRTGNSRRTRSKAKGKRQPRDTPSLVKCRYYWEKHRNCDTDSESSTEGEGYQSDDSIEEDLDVAFVNNTRASDIDEGIDVTSLLCSELNVAFMAEIEGSSVLDTQMDRTSEHNSKYNSNILTGDFAGTLFDYRDENTIFEFQDDDMSSFMRSRLKSF